MEKGAILRHNYQTWQQYDNDLNNLTMWLDQAETTLTSQDNSGDIGDLEGIIRMYTVRLLFLLLILYLSLSLLSISFSLSLSLSV